MRRIEKSVNYKQLVDISLRTNYELCIGGIGYTYIIVCLFLVYTRILLLATMLSRKKKSIITQIPSSDPPLQTTPLMGSGKGKVKGNTAAATSTNQPYLEKARLLHVDKSVQNAIRNVGSGNIKGYVTSNDFSERKAPVAPSKDSVVNAIIPNLTELVTSENQAERARELKRLMYCLNDWDNINDDTILKLIDGLKSNLEGLDEKMNPILEQIINGNWITRPSKIVRSVEGFISEMMVVRPGFAGQAMHSMVFRFNPANQVIVKKPEEILSSQQKVFSIAHRNVKRILAAFPTMKESVTKTMEAAYPYMGKLPHIHYCFVSNILSATDYMSQSTDRILQLIIHKLCRIDVNISREDVEEMHEMLTEIKSEDGGHIFMDYGSTNVNVNPLITVLDLCLALVFEYFENVLLYTDSRFKVSEVDHIVDSLCSTYEKELLTTFNANHVQFLYLYLVSRKPEFVSKFLDFLWGKATSTFLPVVVRIQAMANMSGLLSRSLFIPIKTVKRWLTRMADWANAYVDVNVKNSHWSTVNVQAHFPFYAVCQAIFYVFGFRNKELIGSRKCVAYTRALNLGRLVTCDLNPLKACVEMVAETFVSAAHHHQISYCRTVLERNEKATVPTILAESLDDLGEEAAAIAMNSMECFFPFAPFLLPRSRKWIDPIFRIYEPYLPEVKIEKQEISDWTCHGEDSIEMELSVSFKDESSFFSTGMINTSDIKDEDMDDFID